MTRPPKAPVDPDDAPLKRLGGGRWQTRDERFMIEPQSGTWVIVDGEQTDDLGMALVRGPFPSLTIAKAAIATARASAPAASPLTERIERRRAQPVPDAPPRDSATTSPTRRFRRGEPRKPTTEAPQLRSPAEARAGPARAKAKRDADEAREPGWLSDLEAAERGRARRLIDRLLEDGIPDAEGLVRRDVVGHVPALAAAAIARRLSELDADATPNDVAELLADGRDDRLGVRWRLVDGDGRPIVLDHAARRR